jgi:hypothetical protein
MTEEEKILKLEIFSDVHDPDILSAYLDLAKAKILVRAYPFRNDVTELPERYSLLQVEIANHLIAKRGMEGQTGHNENGIDRSYSDADIPADLLRQIIPEAKVL